MRLIAHSPISVAPGVTLPEGAVFDPAEYRLSERDVEELVAIGAASLACEPPAPAPETRHKKERK